MFNDKYLLTQAVLRGDKTQTRRIVKDGTPLGNFEETMKHAPYKVGEVVAVAQSYKAIYDELEDKDGNCVANEWWCDAWDVAGENLDISAGNTNKMFVKPELMPNRIKITMCALNGGKTSQMMIAYVRASPITYLHLTKKPKAALVSSLPKVDYSYSALLVRHLPHSSIRLAAKVRGKATLMCGCMILN